MTYDDIKEIITFSKQLGFDVNDNFEKTEKNPIKCTIKFPESGYYQALIDFTYNDGVYFDVVNLRKFNSFMNYHYNVYIHLNIEKTTKNYVINRLLKYKKMYKLYTIKNKLNTINKDFL